MSDNDNEEKQKQRPNAHYKLSNENAKDGEIVYHYSRERRLEKAPQSVRDLYKAEPYRFSLIKPLIRSKPLAISFISIIVACIAIMLISQLGLAGTNYTLDGNQLSIQAIRFEGTIIMVINKSITPNRGLVQFSRSAPAYTGAVEIAVQPVMKSGAADARDEVPGGIFFQKIFFTFEPRESYRFSVPFDTDELAVVLRSETKTLQLTVKTE